MTCKSRPSPQTEYAGRTHAMRATYVREWLGFVVADHAQRRAQAADLVVPDHQCHAVAAVLFAIAQRCGCGGERVLFRWEVLSEVHLGECRRTLEKSGIRGPTIIA